MSETAIVNQNNDRFYGCVPLDKSNTFVVEGGAPATLNYQVRDSNGTAVDLTNYFSEGDTGEEGENGIFAKFAVADNTSIAKQHEQGKVLDARNGLLQIPLPDYVWNLPCIYTFHLAIGHRESFTIADTPIYIAPGKGVVLVEWTPFVKHSTGIMLPRVVPALEDIRRKLDDFVGKNDLLGQVEFSADDIVNAMIRPVSFFNELPPRLRRFEYTVATFPYYENWVTGTAAELLQLAVVHYTRNKLLSSHGGLQGDEKARDREYQQLAMFYKKEFQEWARFKKHQLNYSRGQGWGTLFSEYRGW
jgi:hypothetical protein